MGTVEEAATLRFSSLARRLSEEARRHGLVVPAFRSPPRVNGADRTLRRRSDGTHVVSIRVVGRTSMEILDDLIDGVLLANDLEGPAGAGWRLAFHLLLATDTTSAAA